MGEQVEPIAQNAVGGKQQEACMEVGKISRTLIRRLPIYLEHLKSLPGEDGNISATAIARNLGMGHVMVRKDLAKVSVEGRCRTGRSRKQLIHDIEDFLAARDAFLKDAGFERDAK